MFAKLDDLDDGMVKQRPFPRFFVFSSSESFFGVWVVVIVGDSNRMLFFVCESSYNCTRRIMH
jgi:hypothetical protein